MTFYLRIAWNNLKSQLWDIKSDFFLYKVAIASYKVSIVWYKWSFKMFYSVAEISFNTYCETLDHKTSHMGQFSEFEIYTSYETWINNLPIDLYLISKSWQAMTGKRPVHLRASRQSELLTEAIRRK